MFEGNTCKVVARSSIGKRSFMELSAFVVSKSG